MKEGHPAILQHGKNIIALLVACESQLMLSNVPAAVIADHFTRDLSGRRYSQADGPLPVKFWNDPCTLSGAVESLTLVLNLVWARQEPASGQLPTLTDSDQLVLGCRNRLDDLSRSL